MPALSLPLSSRASRLSVSLHCGSDNNDNNSAVASGGRSIEIEMRDTAYASSAVKVTAGEKVRLVFHNTGKVDHDAFIGDDMAPSRP